MVGKSKSKFMWISYSLSKWRFSCSFDGCRALSGENWQLVIDEPVEVQDFKRITDRFRGIYKIYLKWIKLNWKMSTCNRLDLESLGSWPTMPKNFPGTVVEGRALNKFELRMVMKFDQECRLISVKHKCFWYLFLEPHPTIYYSNTSVWLR